MNPDEKNNQNKNENDASTSTYDRPLHVDKNSYDPLTIARMTDHNVTGSPDMAEDVGPSAVDNRFSRKPNANRENKPT